jgi:hypothetical protein
MEGTGVRIYATFSGSKYHDTTQRIVEDAPKFGVDEVRVADDFWLKNFRPDYWEKVSWFRNRHNGKEGGPRGVDWFVFKPFVVLDAFRRLNDGDIVLWTDADTFPIADLSWLYDQCERDGGAMLFAARGCINSVWTKRDVFVAMGCDQPKYHEAWQTVGRFMLFQKGGAFPVEDFLGQWLGFTANPMINTFEPSILGLPDYPGFRENRCEQSVLSNLRVRYGLPLYREACQFGCFSEKAHSAREIDIPRQFFHQEGAHSYRPGFTGDESEGSAFRTVED